MMYLDPATPALTDSDQRGGFSKVLGRIESPEEKFETYQSMPAT